jgi:hypothetical protein
MVRVTFACGATARDAEPSLHRLGTLLSGEGPFRIAYDLGKVASIDDELTQRIADLHRQHARNIARIAFSSPFALVRGSALAVGSAVRRVPCRTFAVPEAMLRWVAGEAS